MHESSILIDQTEWNEQETDLTHLTASEVSNSPIWFIFTNDLDYITLKNSLSDAKNGKYLFNILKRLNPSLNLGSVVDCWLGLILFWNVGLAGGFDRKMEFIVTGDFTIVIWKWGINQSIWHQFRTHQNNIWIKNHFKKLYDL